MGGKSRPLCHRIGKIRESNPLASPHNGMRKQKFPAVADSLSGSFYCEKIFFRNF